VRNGGAAQKSLSRIRNSSLGLIHFAFLLYANQQSAADDELLALHARTTILDFGGVH
jgi:hypothetical protein